MSKRNLGPTIPTFGFPRVGKNTHAHSLWLSNLFVDLTHVGPNPILQFYLSYLTVASTDHQAMIANVLLMWYMFLGGHVEEETVWAVDKAYEVFSLFFRLLNVVYTSDSLEAILSHLSTRVIDSITSGNHVQHLDCLLRFLAAWEK